MEICRKEKIHSYGRAMQHIKSPFRLLLIPRCLISWVLACFRSKNFIGQCLHEYRRSASVRLWRPVAQRRENGICINAKKKTSWCTIRSYLIGNQMPRHTNLYEFDSFRGSETVFHNQHIHRPSVFCCLRCACWCAASKIDAYKIFCHTLRTRKLVRHGRLLFFCVTQADRLK